MGIFDFFKRKNDTSSNTKNTQSQSTEIYRIATRYKEYIKAFINLTMNGSFAPIAAYEQNDGAIIGYVYTSDDNYGISATEAVNKMKKEFSKRLQEKSIASYAILYHSLYKDNGDHTIADGYYEPSAISIIFADKERVYKTVAIPYQFDEDNFSVGTMTKVSHNEFQEILNTEIQEGKDYFQERIVMKPTVEKNEHDVTIKGINIGSVGDLWRGMFGFEHFEKMPHDFLNQHILMTQSMENRIQQIANVEVFQLDFTRMSMRSVCQDRNMVSFFPRIKTDTKLDVTLRYLDEWQHVQNLEATVSGNGRDTFGIRFYALDYAHNRDKYRTNKVVQMHISGIIYVLDKHDTENETLEDGTKFHPEFCSYMPSQEWSDFGCFDFIAKLENIEKINAFQIEEHSGYILTLKLINNEEVSDFFTIDMFVNEKNMRFDTNELQVGMKLTGMFQMLGEIAE